MELSHHCREEEEEINKNTASQSDKNGGATEKKAPARQGPTRTFVKYTGTPRSLSASIVGLVKVGAGVGRHYVRFTFVFWFWFWFWFRFWFWFFCLFVLFRWLIFLFLFFIFFFIFFLFFYFFILFYFIYFFFCPFLLLLSPN